ncbi:MAG: hypothetical protein J07HQW1_01862 [Haloquadratum walsbyi J07HQW1]|uniref:Uncharacterized protein n=1 Tax=Haloquadratum walsbyi J07HQW1 TaxID=1238424 RepID=U1N5X0_9EURY|nr:MAG: hypothetical protein J07HQW1_01862 [Haloquadratum walsbyi J07HQW1]
MVVCGGGLIHIGLSDTALRRILFLINGIGVVFSVSYEWVTTFDRSELLPAEWVIWVVTAMALITIVPSERLWLFCHNCVTDYSR